MKKILPFFFILVLALSIRVAYIIGNDRPPEADEEEHDRLAVSLAEERGYIDIQGSPTSLRPPFYAVFLAFIYRVFGHNLFAAKIVQAVLGTLSVLGLSLIARKIFNEPAGLLTGVVASFYMPFVVCANLLYNETLFTFLLIAITFWVIVLTERTGAIQFFVVGILCALLTLTRAAGFFVPGLIAVVLLAKFPFKRAAILFSILFLGFALVLTPWAIRNYNVHHRFVLVSTNAGMNIYQGIRPVGGKIFGLGPRDEIAKKANSISNEADKSSFYVKASLEAYREDPKKALKMLLMRCLFFWSAIDWEVMGGDTINYHYVFILPFALLGLISAFRDRKDILFLSLVIVYFASLVLVFQATPRYRMPIDGYLIAFGSFSVHRIVASGKKRIYPAAAVSLYLVLTYILYRYSAQTKYFVRDLMEKIGLW